MSELMPTTQAGRKIIDAEMPWHSEDCEFRSDSDSPCDCGLEHFVTRAEAEAARAEHDQHLAVQVEQAERIAALRAALTEIENDDPPDSEDRWVTVVRLMQIARSALEATT